MSFRERANETAPGNRATGGAGADAVVTLAAMTAGDRYEVSTITWSYSAKPTAGGITITDASGNELDHDITQDGPGQLEFDPPLGFDASSQVVATLKGGGGAIVGKLHINVRATTQA